MRLSGLLGRTLRQPPSDAHLLSHQLLARAGYVRGLEAGLFAYLPLGQGVLSRLQRLVRRELALVGGQEVAVPLPPDGEPAGHPGAPGKPRDRLIPAVARVALRVCTCERCPSLAPARAFSAPASGRSSEIHAFGGEGLGCCK